MNSLTFDLIPLNSAYQAKTEKQTSYELFIQKLYVITYNVMNDSTLKFLNWNKEL